MPGWITTQDDLAPGRVDDAISTTEALAAEQERIQREHADQLTAMRLRMHIGLPDFA